MRYLRQKIVIFFCLVYVLSAKAQEDSVFMYLSLQGITISAPKNLNSYDFIEKILADSSFAQTYRNYRYYPHSFSTSLKVQDKDAEDDKGFLQRKAKKHLAGEYAWVTVNQEKMQGKLKKRNGNWRFYTIEMLDDLVFFTEPRKVSLAIGNVTEGPQNNSRIEKHKAELKKMLFSPGAEINSVPLIGKKMAIFDADMAQLYDYSIWESTLNDSLPVYGFSIKAKEDVSMNKTVIKEMTSYFNKENFDLMKRSYTLQQNTLIYDFNVTISVENDYIKGILLPLYIAYKGNWSIPLYKREAMEFELWVEEYKITN
ncbi:MAG: hypothetical protein ACXITV_06280 [Luteibaculaceae bacterium]